MTREPGQLVFPANFERNIAAPLDAAQKVNTLSALTSPNTFRAINDGIDYSYVGMYTVVVGDSEQNNGFYILKQQPTTNIANWVKLQVNYSDQLTTNSKTIVDAINEVNEKTGNVTLAAGDIGITAIEGVEGENIQAALEAINTKASTAYKYKGSKATYEELPAENNTVGDVWNVVAAHGTTPAGTNYAWTGDAWDALGGLVDLSTYQTKAITIDGEPTTVEAAITANKTSAANNTAAINKNKTDIEAVSGSVKGLDTLVKSKQDATVDVSVNGTSYTTIPEAIGALDAYVGEVKAVSDGAAKIDASNITDTGAWKNKLGYALESSLNTVATNVDTVSSNLKALSTKVDTISGDLDTLEVSVAAKASNTDLQAVSAQVDINTAAIGTKATQADMTALSGKVEANTSAIAAANAAIEGKADKATTLAGYNISDAYTKTETNSAIDAKIATANEALQAAIDAKVAKADIATSIPSEAAEASDTKVASQKAVATAVAGINTAIESKANKSTTLSGYGITDAYTKTETGEQITSAVNGAKSELQTAIDGKVAKTDITTVIAESSAASDTKVPSEKAVASAIEEVKAVASTTYKYKGSDTYENIAAKEDPAVGDVWNSTTANGVYPKGTNYAWNGEEWDALGGEVDLSAYQLKSITVGETPTTVEAAINANKTAIDTHVAKQDNPHNVTATQVGLGNVNNTADADKPISTAQQAALDLKQDKTDNTLTTTSKTVVGAINEVKGVADAAAKADASNITVATWKEKLGFITASEVPEQVQPDWNAASGKGQILNKPDVKANSIDTTISSARRFGKCMITNIEPEFRFMNNSTFAQARVIAYVGKSSMPDAIYTFNVNGPNTIINTVICEKITDNDLSNFDIVVGSDSESHTNYLAFKNTKTDSENALFVSYELIIMV